MVEMEALHLPFPSLTLHIETVLAGENLAVGDQL
jgi:hypothetical protein